MKQRLSAVRLAFVKLLVLAVACQLGAQEQAPKKQTTPPQPTAPSDPQKPEPSKAPSDESAEVVSPVPDEFAEDRQQIEKSIKSYVDAFNQADAAKVAGHWSADGEFVTPMGETLRGREAIEAAFKKYFEKNKESRIEVPASQIDFVSPSVAIETGVSRLIQPDQAPTESEYEAVHVKQDGKWKMDSVREADYVPPSSGYQRLRELEWMIGEWIDNDEDVSVETACKWTKNQNFITRSFHAVFADGGTVEGTQVIGWDPLRQTIRSWTFDSEGAFGVGVWSRKDNQWTVKMLMVQQSGATASAINTLTYVDENSFTFKSSGRQVDGQFQPNIPEVTIVRK